MSASQNYSMKERYRGLAVHHAVCVKNRLPASLLGNITMLEMACGEETDLSQLDIF